MLKRDNIKSIMIMIMIMIMTLIMENGLWIMINDLPAAFDQIRINSLRIGCRYETIFHRVDMVFQPLELVQ